MISSTRLIAALAATAVIGTTSAAHAFCGFYVGGADTKLYNNATMVVMMRSGTRTVLSMANNYQGPPEKFAMVVPVPVVLQKEDVKTLPRKLFDRVDKLAAPRLVEYWEQDPCTKGWGTIGKGRYGTIGHGSGTGSGYGAGMRVPKKVKVEARFVVAEYEVVILSATEATALEQWITGNGYRIPAGSARYLAPYVKSGSKFFVAKVDPKKVKFVGGMAQLSPLRFSYDSKDFNLPIRLGLINANKTQDLIVHILAKHQRYEVANYPNVTIPTNLPVTNQVRKNFGGFYAALMDATLEQHKGAVVTEYAWDSGTCDPCPGSPLRLSELETLGLDELNKPQTKAAGAVTGFANLVMKRATVKGALHPAIAQRFMRRVWGRLRGCWETSFQAKPRRPKNAGALEFTVTGKGLVSVATVEGADDKKMARCMIRIAKTIRFPRTEDGAAAQVTQPLLFRVDATRRGRGNRGWVLTRLHARYTPESLGEDLVFRAADPIRGGQGGGADKLPQTAIPATRSTFQGRYIIRHPWTGAMKCKIPRRGIWGHPPPSVKRTSSPLAAQNLAFAKRSGVNLTAMVVGDIPGLKATGSIAPNVAKKAARITKKTPPKTKPSGGGKQKDKGPGCGCQAPGSGDAGGTAALALMVLMLVRRRRN